ncbi:SIR2 family protein [Rufibacter sp. LB8]|uniref:SIR2 family protein n=1 Tax=Rufibacter sp. LB8 TaxID=2777781 RepID=UPI00178C2AA9|nr:SIR2 family protein [Rufibacter sp. LB8]
MSIINFEVLDLEKSNLSNKEIETFVLSLVEFKLKKQNKKFHRYFKQEIFLFEGKKSFVEFDAVAPDGIDEIEGPTIIEFKRYYSPKVITDLIRNFSEAFFNFKSILLIFGDVLLNDDLIYLNSLKKFYSGVIHFEFWDYNNLNKLAKKYNIESSKIVSNIGDEILNSTVEIASNIQDWKEDRDLLINKLNQSFKSDEIVFFIGAGASKDAGLPNWNELLKSLNISIIESKVPLGLSQEQKDEIVNLLTDLQAGAPLVTASYIQKALGDKFNQEIRSSLYVGMKHLEEQRLLNTIATAARPIRNKVGIKSIITYNFDDLLEQHLSSKSIDYKSIYREGDFEELTKLPIYHVHGFVPSKGDKYKDLEKALLVFSEDGYHSLQYDPYSWSNLVQLKALRENTCILVGLSGIDPNLRRLFSNFAKRFDGCKHYILLERQLKESNLTLTKIQFNSFSNLHHKIQEEVFRELGLRVIWYTDHTEIPNLIQKITEL